MTKPKLKMYAGNRKLNDIKYIVLKNGWPWNQERFDKEGSDYVSFGFAFGDDQFDVAYNTFNGNFIVKLGDDYVTGESVEYEEEGWYIALMDFIYLPLEKKTKAKKKA